MIVCSVKQWTTLYTYIRYYTGANVCVVLLLDMLLSSGSESKTIPMSVSIAHESEAVFIAPRATGVYSNYGVCAQTSEGGSDAHAQ